MHWVFSFLRIIILAYDIMISDINIFLTGGAGAQSGSVSALGADGRSQRLKCRKMPVQILISTD